jgi:hypothetical protein
VKEGIGMTQESGLSRQSFSYLAKAAGLHTEDPHMEKLYAYLQEVLPKLKGAEEVAPATAADKDLNTYIRRYMPQLKRLADLSLSGLDPAIVFRPLAGASDE